jgi:acyl CoA:acetate/3-ketoacid CoA transferase beta subunit
VAICGLRAASSLCPSPAAAAAAAAAAAEVSFLVIMRHCMRSTLPGLGAARSRPKVAKLSVNTVVVDRH